MSKLVFVVCEDRQQEVFIRQWLVKKGFRNHDIRVAELPAGQGSGVAHVQREYPKQVKALRQVNSHDEIGRSLVTVIDADEVTVRARHNMLDNALQQDNQIQRTIDDKIALIVPKRNIETWIHYLQEIQVNELERYNKLTKPSDCIEWVKDFVDAPINSPLKVNAPPSLQEAMIEMQRIT